jgi:hypothetical protein
MAFGRTAVVFSLSVAAGSLWLLAPHMSVSSATVPSRPSLLPPAARALPTDSTFVVGLDIARFIASPLYQKIGKGGAGAAPLSAVAEALRAAGLDPERNLSQLVVAGDGRPGGSVLALVSGKFEKKAVEKALAGRPELKKRESKTGTPIWVGPPRDAETPEPAMAVLADGLLLAGPADGVSAGLMRHGIDAPGLFGNNTLLSLVQRVPPQAAFWMCGDPSVVDRAARLVPESTSVSLPSLQRIVASGEFTPDLQATIVGETVDEKSAKGVADMVQGLLSLVSLGATQRPELKDLISGVAISSEGARVNASVKIRYETLEKLQGPAPVAPAPRPTVAGN